VWLNVSFEGGLHWISAWDRLLKKKKKKTKKKKGTVEGGFTEHVGIEPAGSKIGFFEYVSSALGRNQAEDFKASLRGYAE